MTDGIKEAKLKLQDELLDLIDRFEKEWDANVGQVTVYKQYLIGDHLVRTAYVEVRVEV